MRNESDRHRVVAVATAGGPVFELAAAIEVFGTVRRDVCPDWYEFELVTAGEPVEIQAGLRVAPGRGPAALVGADTVVVPACASIHAGSPPELLAALRAAHEAGARILALCSGAFVLAEAGLLAGRRATTHWMHARELRRLYPDIAVDPAVLYVEDGGVWTSAGSAAALDLCLEAVRRDHGAAVAREVARRIVVPPQRSGGQAQYIPRDRPRSAPLAAPLHEWVLEHLRAVTVEGMARHAGVSTRTLHRRFVDELGIPPREWLREQRVRAAQELLAGTRLPIDTVAARTGFGSAANLRSHFSVTVGASPSGYRNTFSDRVSGQRG